MSLVNFIYGQLYPGFRLGAFTADMTIVETHERTSDITDEPVEDGATIQDHIIRDPERITLEGFITDTPIILSVGGATGIGKTVDAFGVLDDIWRRGDVMIVETAYKRYENMVITSLTMPKNTPNSMRFTVELKQINYVSTQEGDVPVTTTQSTPSDDNVNDRAQPETDAGQQPTSSGSSLDFVLDGLGL